MTVPGTFVEELFVLDLDLLTNGREVDNSATLPDSDLKINRLTTKVNRDILKIT